MTEGVTVGKDIYASARAAQWTREPRHFFSGNGGYRSANRGVASVYLCLYRGQLHVVTDENEGGGEWRMIDGVKRAGIGSHGGGWVPAAFSRARRGNQREE